MRRVWIAVVVMLAGGCQYMPWNQENSEAPQKTGATTMPQSTGAAPMSAPTGTLYSRLGGEKAIRALVDDFVPRAAADEKVNFTRDGHTNHWDPTPENLEHLKVMLVEFLGHATGGPQAYEGRDMAAAHKGMEITDAEFDACVVDLKVSLDKLNVPAQEQVELMVVVQSTRAGIVETGK